MFFLSLPATAGAGGAVGVLALLFLAAGAVTLPDAPSSSLLSSLLLLAAATGVGFLAATTGVGFLTGAGSSSLESSLDEEEDDSAALRLLVTATGAAGLAGTLAVAAGFAAGLTASSSLDESSLLLSTVVGFLAGAVGLAV